MSSSDSDTDSTVISDPEGSQNVQTEEWDFEETCGDTTNNENDFGGIVEPCRIELCANDSEEKAEVLLKMKTLVT